MDGSIGKVVVVRGGVRGKNAVVRWDGERRNE